MFERFTDRARRVVVLAQEEAKMLNHDWIGTEHILLGLIHEAEGVGAQALTILGISLDVSREHVEDLLGKKDSLRPGHIPFTPRAKKVLEFALREALRLSQAYIGTEHILLGLIREGEGVGAQVIKKQGVDLADLRKEVIRLLSSYKGRQPDTQLLDELDDEPEGPIRLTSLYSDRSRATIVIEAPEGQKIDVLKLRVLFVDGEGVRHKHTIRNPEKN